MGGQRPQRGRVRTYWTHVWFHQRGRYGDRLVYEALQSKWVRYHRHCTCGNDWVAAHAIPAGFTIVKAGSGWVGLVGPGLTEGVDEDKPTVNALWEAVTGRPGSQSWFEDVTVLPPPVPRTSNRRAMDGSSPVPPRATWRQLNSEWVIRAKNIKVGDRITVYRRDGTGSEATVAEVLREEPAGWQWARPLKAEVREDGRGPASSLN